MVLQKTSEEVFIGVRSLWHCFLTPYQVASPSQQCAAANRLTSMGLLRYRYGRWQSLVVGALYRGIGIGLRNRAGREYRSENSCIAILKGLRISVFIACDVCNLGRCVFVFLQSCLHVVYACKGMIEEVVLAEMTSSLPFASHAPTMRCCQPLDVYGVASAPVWAVAELGRWNFPEVVLKRISNGLGIEIS